MFFSKKPKDFISPLFSSSHGINRRRNLKNRLHHTSSKTSILFSTLFLFVVIGAFFVNPQGLQNFFFTVFSPLTKTGIIIADTAVSFMNPIIRFGDIISEYDALKKENKRLVAAIINLDKIEKENILLRKQLGVDKPNDYILKETHIVSFDSFSFRSFAVINLGLDDGILKGMPVVLPGNILLGSVFEVFPHHARIMLISEKNNKMSVRSQLNETSGVVNGALGNVLLMDLIEKDALLQEGELIMTSGMDGTYPSHLVVGRVQKIIESEEGIFKQAYVTPSYNFVAHSLVFVLMR